ncbi:USF [Lepeophtheirus salmonis]|uniref:USF n=1 Tax=Lepeophtheirus salmonis TaxID=72036 RepID=A0A7R8CDK9_LEPSM|nr:USF [Lepeophtheirus salmonis]CAF2781875.1 USF [Lepeophtheirus salmonis]
MRLFSNSHHGRYTESGLGWKESSGDGKSRVFKFLNKRGCVSLLMSSESPPSPEARTQLIIVGSTDEDEVGTVVSEAQPGGEDGSTTTTTTETVVSEANGGSVTYRVVSTNDDSVIGSPMNGGQFYVIGNPSEVIGSVSAPSSVNPGLPQYADREKTGNPLRDDRRRATHNEVERRRRDMINTWIMKLARLIPNLANTSGKSNHSKGGILAKACEYLQNTKTQISRFEEIRKANEALTKENERLVQAVTNFRKENAALKKQVESLGVTPETIKFEL